MSQPVLFHSIQGIFLVSHDTETETGNTTQVVGSNSTPWSSLLFSGPETDYKLTVGIVTFSEQSTPSSV